MNDFVLSEYPNWSSKVVPLVFGSKKEIKKMSLCCITLVPKFKIFLL